MRAWRDLVDRAVVEVGPVTPALARHWRSELDDVERRVTALERSAPGGSPDDGLHAFLALASARVGDGWDSLELVDVAAAVELAFRATQHHRVVANDTALSPSTPRPGGNTGVVLDGDWSITQAAVLVADVGPRAYRMLVRAYGATQVGQLSGVADPLELMRAAVSLGVLVTGSPDEVADAIWAEAQSEVHSAGRRSVPAAVLAWAIQSLPGQSGQSSPGTVNAVRVAATVPADVHPPSTSMTTRPAVGRS